VCRIAFCIGAILLSVSLAGAAQNAPDLQEAIQLLRAEDYKGALKELNLQLAEHPGDPTMLRLKGACQIELGDLVGAVKSLERALRRDPANVSAKFYLARAQAALGNVVEAIQLLKEVRAAAPDSAYAQKASIILPDLENLKSARGILPQSHRWHLSLRTGMEYDDNVPALPNGFQSGLKASASTVMSAALGYRLLDEKRDKAPLSLDTSYGIYGNLHWRAPLSAFDLLSQSGSVTVAKSARAGSWPANAKLTGGCTDNHLGGAPFDTEWGLGASIALQPKTWFTLTPSYSAKWETYQRKAGPEALFSRNGFYETVGLMGNLYTFHNRMVWSLGYAYEWDNTVGSQFDLSSHAVDASVAVTLPRQFRWSVGFGYQNAAYSQFTPAPVRLDNIYSLATDISHSIWQESLRGSLVYNHTSAVSNQSFSEFDRNLYGLEVTWTY
jgi:tetratricopeptide (TPR) repeat protein